MLDDRVRICVRAFLLVVLAGVSPAAGQTRIALSDARVLVDAHEPSFVQYAANDLASYLTSVSGRPVPVKTTAGAPRGATTIALGAGAAAAAGVDLGSMADLGAEGYVLRVVTRGQTTVIVVAGLQPRGTNAGVATLLQLIRADGNQPYLDAPADRREVPSFAARGIHLNGWPLNYPYAFRAWKEADWKRFIDIAWAQRINLIYLWPFMEILPVPLSSADEAYLQEVQRVVDYAQRQRGMDVWIMQSANRIGTSDCGTPDPRHRAYWVNNCQKDMNPADPEQFARIERSFEAFYRIVNNADAYVMIDSDPGSWPQSPISDQVRIFNAARRLLDKYAVHATQTRLVDWMHVGWGRHKFFTSTDAVVAAYDWTSKNPDESDVAFMGQTIRAFKAGVPEPWGLIAGQPPYLSVVRDEQVLDRTVYLPYGAIESEPAFPATNLGQESVRRVFDRAAEVPGLRGVMGNNQLMLLQFPRTFYFFGTAWDTKYAQRPERDVLLDLATQLYPDERDLVADAFLALRETDAPKVEATLSKLTARLATGGFGRPGAIGRLLFPDPLVVARSLRMQLEIRAARQDFIAAMRGTPTVEDAARLLETYFDRLLAWNKETGWDRMIDITVWPREIYEDGPDLTESVYRLKHILARGEPYTSYSATRQFFTALAQRLLQRYGEDSVMVGCIEPFKLAVIQSQ